MRTIMSTVWLAAAATPACLQGDEPGGELDDEIAANTSETEQEINAGVNDVGVIPDLNVGCPSGSEEITIRMDDEDDGNRSRRTGWVGKTNFGETSSATKFYFCKVDGSRFRPFEPFTSAGNVHDDYAVLKLGTTCPNDSQMVKRHFDNEDSDNRNSSTGVIDPNVTRRSGSFTDLYFCLFRHAAPGNPTMPAFPDLGTGFHYGVFGPANSSVSATRGTIRSDDEDDDNANSISAPSDALFTLQFIISEDTTVTHGATNLRTLFAR